MGKYIAFIFFILFSLSANAQHEKADTLQLDLDKDLVKDMVIFDRENAVIIVKLSSQKFMPVKSKELDFDEVSSGISIKREGFEFANNWMRAGYAFQFRYNPSQKQIQLIGMSRYEFGPASNDGSGESSLNLLTNSYIGNWHHWDEKNSELIAMPSIKQKMTFPTTYLANFNDEIFYKFQDLCVNLYRKAKDKIIAESNTAKYSFTDTHSKQTVQVKVLNPCDLRSPPWDARQNNIEAVLVNGKQVTKVVYSNPSPETSLIYFDKKEITVKSFNGKSAVFVPFYYCGNSEDNDKIVSYILFYNKLTYICHLSYNCKNEKNCYLELNKSEGLKQLPTSLNSYFIKYANAKHQYKTSFHQD